MRARGCEVVARGCVRARGLEPARGRLGLDALGARPVAPGRLGAARLPPLGVTDADGRALEGADAPLLGVAWLRGETPPDGPALEGRDGAARAEGRLVAGLVELAASRRPGASLRAPADGGVRREMGADGRLTAPPRVVVAAATGRRPTVGTSRPAARLVGVLAPPRGARRTSSLPRAVRAALPEAAPVRGARRFTDVVAEGALRAAPATAVLEGAVGTVVALLRLRAVRDVDAVGFSLYRAAA